MSHGLDFQNVAIQCVDGVDTYAQWKRVINTKWRTLTNYTFQKDGSLHKRDGMQGLVASANGNSLATFNNELLVANGPSLSSVAPSISPLQARTVNGSISNVFVTAKQISTTGGLQDSFDCAYGAGVTFYVWRNLSTAGTVLGLSVAAFDEASGTRLLTSQLVTSANISYPRVAFYNGGFYVFWQDGVSINSIIWIASSLSFGSGVTTLAGAGAAGKPMDVVAAPAASGIIITFVLATQMRLMLITGPTTPTLSAQTTAFAPASLDVTQLTGVSLCLDATGNFVAIFTQSLGAATCSGIGCSVFPVLLTSTYVTATSIDAVQGTTNSPCGLTSIVATSTDWILVNDFRSEYGTLALTPLRTNRVRLNVGSVTVVSSFSSMQGFTYSAASPVLAAPQGPFVAGKLFGTVNGSIQLPVSLIENYGFGTTTQATNLQNTIFTLTIDPAITTRDQYAVTTQALYGRLGVGAPLGTSPTVTSPCSTPAVPSGWALACAQQNGIVTPANSVVAGSQPQTFATRMTYSINTTASQSRTQVGGATFFAGGLMSMYDGGQGGEADFTFFPEGISVVAGGAGTGSMTAGVHLVTAVYEWTDGSGQRHQSAPCVPVSVTTVNTDSLSVRVSPLRMTRRTSVNIVVYMTAAAGTTFYRYPLPSANSLVVTNILVTTNLADANLITQETLYSQPTQAGTTLPNDAPPPCTVLGQHQSRLFFDKADKPGKFGYSLQAVPGVGLQFNETLEGQVDPSAGLFAGFLELDEKVIIFTANKLYVMFGSGPNSAGLNNGYSDPQEIPSDVGCLDARTIVRMPIGIIFKSLKGWYLLGRDLSVKYIGEAVKGYDASTISSAVLLGGSQEVRFTVSSPATFENQAPTALSFNYVRGQWSILIANDFSFNQYSPADSLWWPAQSKYVHLTTTQGLNYDNVGVYSDNVGNQGATPINTLARTAFIHVSEMEGFQRVRWLYFAASAAQQPTGTLNIRVEYDDDLSSTQPAGAYITSINLASIPFPLGSAASMTERCIIDLRHKLHRQKCKSVCFSFSDTPSNASDPGILGIQALGLQVGVKKGVNRLPAAQSVG